MERPPLTSIGPLQIEVISAGRGLVINWSDGAKQRLSAGSLRRISRSAESVRNEVIGLHVDPDGDLTIKSVSLIGRYAINILFSDGYDKGIYPWDLLRSVDQSK